MTSERSRAESRGAAPRSVPTTTTASVAATASEPWYADTIAAIEWWLDPGLAYRKGLEDGLRLAREEAAREHEEMLAQVFGTSSRHEGVMALLVHLDQAAARGRGWSG